jgi:hypothetical protein
MLGLNLPVLRRDGRVDLLTQQTSSGSINLPQLSEQLYRSARWLRVFSAKPIKLDPESVLRYLS